MVEIGLPTVDRPFGIHLWPIFDDLWLALTGDRASNFAFVPGKTFMSTYTEVVGAIIAYYVVIFSGREFMRSRSALKLNSWFQLHNIGLTILSAVLWALLFEQIFPIIVRRGVFYSICSAGAWTQPLVFIYYVSSTSHEIRRTRRLIDSSSTTLQSTLNSSTPCSSS